MSTQFKLSRRDLLLSLPALSVARAVFAQSGTKFKIRALNHMTIAVTDPKRTIDFYQTLFGMPIQAHQGPGTTVLRIGPGPQFMAVGSVGAGQSPSITHYCVTDRRLQRRPRLESARRARHHEGRRQRADEGPRADARSRSRRREGRNPGNLRHRSGWHRRPASGSEYGGGAGVLGDVLKVEPSPKKGLIALEDLSHFTISEKDSTQSNKFYQDLFGMGFRSYQGPTAPTLAIGSGVQFVMFTGGGGGARAGAPPAPPRPATIGHASFSMKNFNVETVQKALESVGIKPRQGNGPAGPMQHYVSMRMENRGGAKEGTPELYFTDPDGLLMQIQDVSYCGGGGYLGNVCPAS